jgi:phosphate starvation-inducible PhoH-like protein
VIVAGAVTQTLRELGLADAPSRAKFVPEQYLSAPIGDRLALLQGLLDCAGAPVEQHARTCSIEYTTPAARLRDDVVYLVRSLGGIAVTHGPTLDIRLPAGLEPFRLRRKAEAYAADGRGRPMRFVESIEPEGDEECVCIAVAAADSLYVTDDFLVTHNTLNDSFVILDEAQNTSPEQMKMFLTRLGFNSKMVITGDITQVDLPRDQQSGLIVVTEILREVEGIEFVRFGREDVVRHRLVQRIVDAYADAAQRGATELRAADRKRA